MGKGDIRDEHVAVGGGERGGDVADPASPVLKIAAASSSQCIGIGRRCGNLGTRQDEEDAPEDPDEDDVDDKVAEDVTIDCDL
jgi:hypothetical protein